MSREKNTAEKINAHVAKEIASAPLHDNRSLTMKLIGILSQRILVMAKQQELIQFPAKVWASPEQHLSIADALRAEMVKRGLPPAPEADAEFLRQQQKAYFQQMGTCWTPTARGLCCLLDVDHQPRERIEPTEDDDAAVLETDDLTQVEDRPLLIHREIMATRNLLTLATNAGLLQLSTRILGVVKFSEDDPEPQEALKTQFSDDDLPVFLDKNRKIMAETERRGLDHRQDVRLANEFWLQSYLSAEAEMMSPLPAMLATVKFTYTSDALLRITKLVK